MDAIRRERRIQPHVHDNRHRAEKCHRWRCKIEISPETIERYVSEQSSAVQR